MKLPKTLGACADRLFAIKEAKGELERKISVLDDERKAIEERLIAELPKSDAGGVLGKLCKAVITRKDVPTVKDWDPFYAYVLRTKDFSLLQRRVGELAIKERWDAGETVPGVEPFTVVKVSVTKLGGK